MVVCNLHIVSLKQSISVPAFLAGLRKHDVKPIVQAQVLRWMILPTQLSAGYLLSRNIQWHLLLGLNASDSIPSSLQQHVEAAWTASCGVSARVLSDYAKHNAALLNPSPGSVKPAQLPAVSDTSNSQNLEFSPELENWIAKLAPPLRNHPVSMLNLLAFNEGKKDQYIKYGTEFSSRVGARHGGNVKIAARVVGGEDQQAQHDGWDEVAFVHYPTVKHFAAMSASPEYQEVNRKYRLGALKDTFILCVAEIDDDGQLMGGRGIKGKL
ncbi:hypothetical protein JX265_006125 [Neoarthrinium moseri]|uniref:DUF1330 domain-containing protein n=1 Tax=Neoarthrinium moseri TaxID=1658444 RepID=A0A9P9WMN5_9PEZI|nr:hypothetical protein JX265_006125 [Neoarthrinium moseri]